MKSNDTQCPSCLGTGEMISYNRYPKVCSLCKGEGVVDAILATDFVSSINEIQVDDEIIGY